jgi:hypothetical protein
MKQRKNAKAWVFKFAKYVLAIGGDDKATANIGEPGTAVAVLAKQHRVVNSMHGNQIAALDHEAGHVRVLMKHNEPTAETSSWYSGQVRVRLKNNIFEASNAFRAMAELLLNYAVELWDQPIFYLHTDGGGEHNLSFPSVQAAIVAFVLKAKPDRGVWGNSCPYHSFGNEPERIMSILNLGIYGVAVARPKIDKEKIRGEESRYTRTKTISELRSTTKAFLQPTIARGIARCVDASVRTVLRAL